MYVVCTCMLGAIVNICLHIVSVCGKHTTEGAMVSIIILTIASSYVYTPHTYIHIRTCKYLQYRKSGNFRS